MKPRPYRSFTAFAVIEDVHRDHGDGDAHKVPERVQSRPDQDRPDDHR
jgi:hypothetical protein